jgi:hypothetical protein
VADERADAMAWVQALVRLWDREQRGYAMDEVGVEAGWREALWAHPGEPWEPGVVPREAVAAAHAMEDGLVVQDMGATPAAPDVGRVLFTPVLG